MDETNTNTKTAEEAAITAAANRGHELVKSLAAKYPQAGLTFGYIGNCERWGDERSWRVFTTLPRVKEGLYNNSPSWGKYLANETKDLPALVAKMETDLEPWIKKTLGLE